jgi:hypothetical protein
VTLKREQCIVAHHPASVVGQADQPPSPALDIETEFSRARVERIFEQLLDDASRPFDHLTGRYFIGNEIGEDANAAHLKESEDRSHASEFRASV